MLPHRGTWGRKKGGTKDKEIEKNNKVNYHTYLSCGICKEILFDKRGHLKLNTWNTQIIFNHQSTPKKNNPLD